MPDDRSCPSCGAAMTEAALRGLCPKCLAREAGLEPDRMTFLGAGLPRTFGDYELLEELGRGGMGVVYKARQKSLNRTVAVKMLLDGPLANLTTAGRFRSEAEAAAQLRHPNIAAIYEIGEQDGLLYFSMDYVTGVSLADLALNQPLSVETSVRLVQTIAETIQFAHQRGTIHRDLKPSNIIVDEQGKPHILDFGLAKRVEARGDFTLTGQSLGSPGYAPPEQVDSKRGSVGVWSDIYGLGAILYYLLTGRPPFAGNSLTDTFYQTLHQPPAPPSSINLEVSRALDDICLKCLEKDPAKRYAGAGDVAKALERATHTSNLHRPEEGQARVANRGRYRTRAALFVFGPVIALGLFLTLCLWRPTWLFSSFQSESHQPAVSIPPTNETAIPLVTPPNDSNSEETLCVITDPSGNLSGDTNRTFLDVETVKVSEIGDSFVFEIDVAGPFPNIAEMIGRQIDFIFLVDADRDINTGQFVGLGNDYNIHVVLNGAGWHSSWYKVAEGSKNDGINVDLKACRVRASRTSVSLLFPKSYLPTKAFDIWVDASSQNSREWKPLTRNVTPKGRVRL